MQVNPVEKAFQLKTLIVDDNESVRVVLGLMLQVYSSEIIYARDGVEAVTAVEKNPDINLIMMDVYMHNMDGFDATRRIRQINKSVIIFVMSATPISELIEDFSGAMINDYFPKPFNKDYLDQLINKHFKKASQSKKI